MRFDLLIACKFHLKPPLSVSAVGRYSLSDTIHKMNVILSEIILFSFRAACELQLVRYGPKHVSMSLSDTPFSAYFNYNFKTMMCLQVCYTSNNSSTTEDALFDVTSGKAVATYKLWPWPCTHIAVSLVWVQLRLIINLWSLRL